MLKKIASLFISLFLLFNLNACKGSKKAMINTNIDNVNVIELDKESLSDKIASEEDFILLIRLEGCSSCEAFTKDVVKPFISKTHANIYSIYAHEVDTMKGIDNAPKYKLAPNIQVYKQGKSICSQDYNDSKKYFTDLNDFEKFIYKYVDISKIIEVSETFLDQAILDKQSIILYIGWYKCGDCVLVKENVLNDYLNNHEGNTPIYYLEVDEYRKNKPSACPDITNATPEDMMFYEYYMKWLNFAKKYNFADYEDGKVPTFQYYDQGKMVDMIVYKNDVVEDEKVIKSYYQELIGQSLKQEMLNEYHKEKVIEFFNKYYNK